MSNLKIPNKSKIIEAIKNKNNFVVNEHLFYASLKSQKNFRDYFSCYLNILKEFCHSQDNEHIEYIISSDFEAKSVDSLCQYLLIESFNSNNKYIRDYIIKNKPNLDLDFHNYSLFVIAIQNKELELAKLIYKKHKFYKPHLNDYNYIAVMESIDYAFNHFIKNDYYIFDWLWNEFKNVIESKNKKFFNRYNNALKINEF